MRARSESPDAGGGSLGVVVLALCACAAIINAWLFRELRHDDAFITFRYARNIALGEGFVFNPGERVLGTSSPLLSLLLALVYRLFGDVLPGAAVMLGSLCLSVQAWLIYRLTRAADAATGFLLAGCVLCGLAGSHTWMALESNLSLALVLGALWAQVVRRPRLCGALLGLAVLARHDTALIALVIAALVRLERRPWPWATLWLAVAIVALWLIFATLYFGSPLPTTLGAKQGISEPAAYVTAYARHFIGFPPISLLPPGVRPWFASGLFASGLAFAVLRCRPLAALCAHGLLLWGCYALIGPPADQHWHMLPATLAFRLVMVLGVVGWSALALSRWPHGRRALVVLELGYLLMLGQGLWASSQTVATQFWLGERHRRYTVVADWINSHVQPGRRFMPAEVGTLGYLTDQRMVDPFGLLTPTNDWPRTMRLESFLELVLRHKPDLVLFGSPGQAAALRRYAPGEPYEVVKVFPWLRPWSTLVLRADRRDTILRR